ncbi:hypothetical protein D3C71_1862590 [compost metagenome]
MQAWNPVKVNNPESVHHGRAGTVMRVEKRGDLQLAQVFLDAQGDQGELNYKPAETEPFAVAELQML